MSEALKLQFKFKCAIKILSGPHKGKEYLFENSPITIGRGVENLIVLANDLKVSRLHLEIRVLPEGVFARSLSHTNQTLLNGQSISDQELPYDCILLLGDTELQIQVHADIPTKVPKSQNVQNKNETANPILSIQEPQPKIAQLDSARSASPKLQGPNKVIGPEARVESTLAVKAKPPSSTNGGASAASVATDIRQSSIARVKKQKSRSANYNVAVQSFSKSRLYLIIGVFLLLGYLIFSGKGKKQNLIDTNKPRLSTDISIEFRSYDELMKEFEARRNKIGTRNFQMAQENFVKGFRDYRQGQYARAKESFQVVINLDSENEMARRYYQLAKLKFDELIKFHMLQGKRYYEKKNWRLCKSGYFNAITMLQNNQSDPLFKEAERYYEACASALEGRF